MSNKFINILFMNDGPELVLNGDYSENELKKVLEKKADEYYQNHKDSLPDTVDYRKYCYWHYHSVLVNFKRSDSKQISNVPHISKVNKEVLIKKGKIDFDTADIIQIVYDFIVNEIGIS